MRIGICAGPWGMTFDEVIAAVQEAERLGIDSFMLGDHFQMARPQASPDPYLLFALLARETSRITFGPQVTPVTFRPPWEVGRLAAQIDILSGGERFKLGLGVGWHEPEHRMYGVPYPPLRERFDRLEEMIQVMQLMWGPGPASFAGRYYQLDNAESLPKPAAGRPPIVIGGGGEKRTLALVAKYADEWNAPLVNATELRRKLGVLAEHCAAVGRDPATIRHSMQSTGPIGATQADVDASTQRQMERNPPPTPMSLAEYRQWLKGRGMIAGGADEIMQSLGELAEAGMQEVQFIYSRRSLPFLANEVLPKARQL